MKTPHKHAELIKAWADGAEIQLKLNAVQWGDCVDPYWNPDLEYRIKPEPNPEVMSYYYVGLDGDLLRWSGLNKHDAHLRLIVDTKTLKIKSAEVLQ